jgi:hypothetical protein
MLESQLAELRKRLDSVVGTDLGNFNRRLRVS